MSKGLKGIMLTVGGLAVFIARGGGGFAGGVSAHSAELTAEAERVEAEGAAHGAGNDSNTCLSAGIVRLRSCDTRVCRVKATIFLRGCLSTAKSSPEFCDGVPRPGGFDTVTWRVKRCKAVVIEPKKCQEYFEAMQVHCHPKR